MFVDSHAHLDSQQFDSDRVQVIDRARQAGFRPSWLSATAMVPRRSIAESSWRRNTTSCYATIGIHPHEARLADEAAYQNMERLARHPKVIAWGEIGLDYFYDHSPRHVQKEVFTRQMESAAAAKLPIVIHCRPSDGSDNAWEDCFELLLEHWSGRRLGRNFALLHRNLAASQARPRYGFHDLVRRESDVSQSPTDS